MTAMIRTQVQLKKRQLLRLRALAAERGLSISELVRNGVDIVLTQKDQGARTTQAQPAISAAGRFRSGHIDVARRHDDVLISNYEASGK